MPSASRTFVTLVGETLLGEEERFTRLEEFFREYPSYLDPEEDAPIATAVHHRCSVEVLRYLIGKGCGGVDMCDGRPWKSTDIHGCPWRMSMDIYGHLRTFVMDIHGYLRMSMDVPEECPWIFMDICDGHSWICTDIHMSSECPWIFMDICGHL